MAGSKATHYATLHEAPFVVTQAARTQPPPPPPPLGITNQVVVDTLSHPDLLQPPQIVGSTPAPPLRPLVPLPTSRPETFHSF